MIQPHNKVYVQNVLENNRELIDRLLFNGKGRLYVCGNIGMSTAVKNILKKWIVDRHKGNVQQADAEFNKLENNKRICIEAWG